jgi:serine/threonine-protein kinase
MSAPSFGRYRVIAPVAKGGMAEVFAGELVGEAGFSRPVAIKSIRPELVGEPEFVTMFLDEARLAANVQSPHVVHTFDLGRTDAGVPFMVMELVLGATVSQLLRACQPGPLPLPFAVEILRQALQGLEDAHSALSPRGEPLRLVHRDLAPKNILVGIDGRTRIMDFGVAHAVERLTRTSTGQVKGTLRYLSPEQADLQPLDQRSDLFAMGIVAFEMLTGTHLFDGHAMMDVYRQVMYQPIPDVRDYVPEIPAPLAEAVAKALERDREERWQRASDFSRALESIAVPRPRDADLRSFVRANLPESMRDLRARLRAHAGGTLDPRSIEIHLGDLLGSDDDEPTRVEPAPIRSDRELPTAPVLAAPSEARGVADAPTAVPRRVSPTTPNTPTSRASDRTKARAKVSHRRTRLRLALLWLALALGLGGLGYGLAKAGVFDAWRSSASGAR